MEFWSVFMWPICVVVLIAFVANLGSIEDWVDE